MRSPIRTWFVRRFFYRTFSPVLAYGTPGWPCRVSSNTNGIDGLCSSQETYRYGVDKETKLENRRMIRC